MAWIENTSTSDSTRLNESLSQWKDEQKRQVPPVIAVMGVSAGHLEAVMKTSFAVTFGGSSLGRYWEELIATAVSAWNRCFY